MDTARTMQQFIEALAAAHEVDLTLPQAQLWVYHPDQHAYLLISNIDSRRIGVAYARQEEEQLLLQMDMTFLLNANGAWFPLEAVYTNAVWDAYVFHAEVMAEHTLENDKGEVDFALFADVHAAQWQAQGWLEKGVRYETAISCSETTDRDR